MDSARFIQLFRLMNIIVPSFLYHAVRCTLIIIPHLDKKRNYTSSIKWGISRAKTKSARSGMERAQVGRLLNQSFVQVISIDLGIDV